MGLESDTIEEQNVPDDGDGQALTGDALESASQALNREGFFLRLVGNIMSLTRTWGLRSPSGDLPGGFSAEDFAMEIVEKACSGRFKWDREKVPDFENFCHSRVRSVISNYWKKQKRVDTVSPVPDEDGESGEMRDTILSGASSSEDIYFTLLVREGTSLGSEFLEDFALSLPDDSLEQKIAMTVLDDRACAERKECIKKLNVSERDFDAAQKRLERKVKPFQADWRKARKLTTKEWQEAR